MGPPCALSAWVGYTGFMAKSAVPHKLLSVEDYLKFEESATVRHEYVGGIVYAFAGATKRHNQITLSIATRLVDAARGGPCRVYSSDVKLRVDGDVFYYPDAMVACGPEGESPIYEDAPCLVVEVVSPGTEAIDRREKLLAYRRLSSVRAYLIVDQEKKRVERHWRDEQGVWWQADLVGEGSVPVPCPEGIELTLAEIYEGVIGVTDGV